MPIDRLHIERLRNLSAVTLTDLQSVNVLYGHNGSGKTSVLEAIHLLSTGRSFRSGLLRQVVQKNQPDALILVEQGKRRLGMLKRIDGEQTIKQDGMLLSSQSELAKQLPVQVIDPEGLALLDSGSKPRRQLMDWLLFHVEPEFHHVWLQYQRALKQRNALLRASASTAAALAGWEHILSQTGQQLHDMRERVFTRWSECFLTVLAELLPDVDIRMTYHAGFDPTQGLLTELVAHRDKDRERGHTSVGAHRADLRFKSALGDADRTLSRGQKKLLIIGLRLSQLQLVHQLSHCASVVLLDDMTAELDRVAQTRLLSSLIRLNSQIFMTTLDLDAALNPLKLLNIQPAVFCVEQGVVTRVEPHCSKDIGFF
ncbi:MAG: replication/repair protein RecF [Pseudomonadota bacterium]|jgi:DNA replication and repair protein RecF